MTQKAPQIDPPNTTAAALVQIARDATPQTLLPMDLVQRAFDAGNLELVERAMALQERWEKSQARKAFEEAMAEVRNELPVITKNRTVDFTSQRGRTNYDYEDLAGIARQIDPILAKHGLSYRFRTKSEGTMLTVTCIISHRDGYSEENSLQSPFDASGNKNPIQAVGSAQTYLQRYTLKAALGLAASKDDDAQAVRENPITTTVTDVIGDPIEYDEQGNPVDNIPRGEAGIERMSKAMARPEYAKLLSDLRNVKDLDHLFLWGTDNANRVESLPLDWQEMLRGEFRDKMISLGWKPRDE